MRKRISVAWWYQKCAFFVDEKLARARRVGCDERRRAGKGLGGANSASDIDCFATPGGVYPRPSFCGKFRADGPIVACAAVST